MYQYIKRLVKRLFGKEPKEAPSPLQEKHVCIDHHGCPPDAHDRSIRGGST